MRDRERVEECRWRRLVGIDNAARKVANRLAVKAGNDRMLGPAFSDNRRPMTMATLGRRCERIPPKGLLLGSRWRGRRWCPARNPPQAVAAPCPSWPAELFAISALHDILTIGWGALECLMYI